jgi:hypothetical protein
LVGEKGNESKSIGQENVPQLQDRAAQAGRPGDLLGSHPQTTAGVTAQSG